MNPDDFDEASDLLLQLRQFLHKFVDRNRDKSPYMVDSAIAVCSVASSLALHSPMECKEKYSRLIDSLVRKNEELG